MNQVRADGMSPMNKAPEGLCRVVLIKKVVFAIDLDQSIGVGQPVGRGGKVISRAGVHAGLRGRCIRRRRTASCKQGKAEREPNRSVTGRMRMSGESSTGAHLIKGSSRPVLSIWNWPRTCEDRVTGTLESGKISSTNEARGG